MKSEFEIRRLLRQVKKARKKELEILEDVALKIAQKRDETWEGIKSYRKQLLKQLRGED